MEDTRTTNYEFVSSIYLFRGIHPDAIFGLLSHVKVHTPKFGSWIYKQGDTDTNIYMVYKGQVSVKVEALDFESRSKRLEEKVSRIGEQSEDGPDRLPKRSIKRSQLRLPSISFLKPFDRPLKNPNLQTHPLFQTTLFLLQSGAYFGDEEGFTSNTKSVSVQASSGDTVLFALDKSKIRLNVADFSKWQRVLQKSEEKRNRVVKRVKEIRDKKSGSSSTGKSYSKKMKTSFPMEDSQECLQYERMARKGEHSAMKNISLIHHSYYRKALSSRLKSNLSMMEPPSSKTSFENKSERRALSRVLPFNADKYKGMSQAYRAMRNRNWSIH